LGESWVKAWNKKPIAPKLKSFPRIAFSMWQFFIGSYCIFHTFSNWISNLKPNMTYNMIKIQLFLHQAFHYSQIYNFILNHDYKLKTIRVFKDVWNSKSKKVYVFLFFECFEHMDLFLWNILKFPQKMKWFGEHLIMKKDFWNKKITCSHFFLSALNI
jgi:hypothetical protein